MNIEPRRAARARQVRQRAFHKCDLLHIRWTIEQHRAKVLFEHRANLRLVGKHFNRHFDLGLDFQFRPQIAHADDQVLQNRHLRLGGEINLLFVGRRIRRQRNRLQRRLAIIHRVPDFFRDERHHRMQQPQRRLKQIDQIRACDSRRSRVRALLEVQPRLDQLEIPIAELAPEKIVDAIRRLIETICLQRLVHVLRRAIEARKNPAVFERLQRRNPAMPAWRDGRPRAVAPGRSPGSIRSTFMNMKRAAFQILLAKLRYPAVRLSLNAISVPGAAIDASVKRVASVPYCPITSIGSSTFPLVFDIFCRSASRTSAWM